MRRIPCTDNSLNYFLLQIGHIGKEGDMASKHAWKVEVSVQ